MALPTEKAARYDRQLRLWGDHGQTALESAHVCLINASATGTETLKNLVLAGVGSFTIVDSKQVSATDLGSNFFVLPSAVESSRGRCACTLLQELNPDVRGSAIEDSVDAILANSPDLFATYSTVIATELPDATLQLLAKVLRSLSVPLIVVVSYGLIGYMRLALPDHEIVESHPDNYHEDLRLDCPFPGLVEYMDAINLDAVDNNKHANIPFLAILYKYLAKWKQSHKAMLPKNHHEKKEFKELIRSGIRKNENGAPLDEENFEEAMNSVNSTVIPTKIPPEVQSLLDDPACLHLTPESSNFWVLVRALKEFVINDSQGKLPLRGSIPDMNSFSDLYVSLQKVYQTQARLDVEAVAVHLSALLIGLGKSPSTVPMDSVKQFCRNSAFLRVVRYRSLADEHCKPNLSEHLWRLENPDGELVYYILLRAAHQFYSMYKFYPRGGDKGTSMDSDVGVMKTIVSNLLNGWELPPSILRDDCIAEFCRYGGAELHSVAAFMGGVASQEIVKILTHQFVPLNNTLIYSAMTCTALTIAL